MYRRKTFNSIIFVLVLWEFVSCVAVQFFPRINNLRRTKRRTLLPRRGLLLLSHQCRLHCNDEVRWSGGVVVFYSVIIIIVVVVVVIRTTTRT